MIRYYFISYVYKTENETVYGDFTMERKGFPERKHLRLFVEHSREITIEEKNFSITSILELSEEDYMSF